MPRTHVSALLLMLALPAAALSAAKPYTISAVKKDDAGKWQKADVLEEARLGVNFEIKFLDPESARAAIKKGLGKDIDLLPGRVDEHKPGFLVFVLQVSNNGQQDVYFNPAQARMISNKADVKFALDYSALFEVARKHGPEAPSLDELASIAFDDAVTIRPGGSARKLLVFDGPREDKYRDLEVHLYEVNIGPTSVDVAFPFKKFFEKENG